MITIRPSRKRGHAQYDWLDTWHTFSFDTYHDPDHMGFRSLRVLNEDLVQPGKGFGMHFHRDMEIITYVIEGELQHKDSLGSGSIIRPGDGQRMSAGSGIMHSEYNPSDRVPVHLLQIWILPAKKGISPGYEQKTFSPDEKRGKFRLIAGPEERNGNVTIHQDAFLYVSVLAPGQQTEYTLAPGRYGWLQVARGTLELNGLNLEQGDGAAISNEEKLSIRASEDSEVLLFDLA